jgi:hypothetical protein
LNGGIAAICTFAAMPLLAASRIGQVGRDIDEREKPTDEESEQQEAKNEKRVSESACLSDPEDVRAPAGAQASTAIGCS